MTKGADDSMNDILILGIAGGSGSGKTTLTDNLLKHFGEQVTVIHHDNYYRAHNDLTLEERRALNYDCPDAFETELMVEHLRLLRQGRSIHCPVYDYAIHNRTEQTQRIDPTPVMIVEGHLSHNKAICFKCGNLCKNTEFIFIHILSPDEITLTDYYIRTDVRIQ